MAAAASWVGGGEVVAEAQELWRSFDGTPVLEGVNLRVHAGEVLVVLGGSGSGKSTLLRHLLGLERGDRGRVRLMGQDLGSLSADGHARVMMQIGMLFQDGALFDSMTVAENVGFALRNVLRRPAEDVGRIVREKLLLVGLKNVESLPPSALSGGMRKRVALARAIAHDPRLLFVDEPTAGLDPVMSDTINELILQLRERLGMAVLCITHDMDAAFRIADRVAMLYQGRIIASGPPDEIRQHTNPVIRQFVVGRAHGPITP